MNSKNYLINRLRGWFPEEIGQSRKQISANQIHKSIAKNWLSSRNFRISCILASFAGAFVVDYFFGFLQSISIITSGMFQDAIVVVFVVMLGFWGWAILQSAPKGKSPGLNQNSEEVNS
jgi:hypothetical protein